MPNLLSAHPVHSAENNRMPDERKVRLLSLCACNNRRRGESGAVYYIIIDVVTIPRQDALALCNEFMFSFTRKLTNTIIIIVSI